MKTLVLFYRKIFTSINNIIDIRHRNYLNKAIKIKIRYAYLRLLLILNYNKSVYEIRKKYSIDTKLINSIQLYEFDNLRNEYEEYIKKIQYLRIKLNGKINRRCYKPFTINEIFLYNPEKNRYESVKSRKDPFSMVFINLKEFDIPKTFNNILYEKFDFREKTYEKFDLREVTLPKHHNVLYYTRLYKTVNKFDITTLINILKDIRDMSMAYIEFDKAELTRRLRRIPAKTRCLARHYKTLMYSKDKKEFDEKLKKMIIYRFFRANFYDHFYKL